MEVGASLRLRWMEDQLRDPELLPLLQKKTAMPKGFRRGADGLLEKAVSPKDWIRVEWAPVVPAGQAHSGVDLAHVDMRAAPHWSGWRPPFG